MIMTSKKYKLLSKEERDAWEKRCYRIANILRVILAVWVVFWFVVTLVIYFK